MKKGNRTRLVTGAIFILAFTLWTLLVKFVSVKDIGPLGSSVGFAELNGFVSGLFGMNRELYILTDIAGLVPIGTALGFALLGLSQWIGRRSISKVDKSIIALGGFYVAVISVYAFFEAVPINYRPVLIDGRLEVSYPSSTTMLVMSVMPAAATELRERIKSERAGRLLSVAVAVFVTLTVIVRILSGVHWITDIIGGALVSTGLFLLFCGLRR